MTDELGFNTDTPQYNHRQEVLNALTEVLVPLSAEIEQDAGNFNANYFLHLLAKKLRDNRRELHRRPVYTCRICGGQVDREGIVHDLCEIHV